MPAPAIVRPPRFADTAGVYRVCFETAFSPEQIAREDPAPELIGHVYAGPYLAYAPAWCRVVADRLGVAGYLLAVPATGSFEAWAEEHWWPPLRQQHPARDGASTPADERAARLLAAPPVSPPAIAAAFPAHLHIDLLPRARGRGFARLLIDDLCHRLRRAGVAGVHLGVRPGNANAIGLYEHLGFTELAREEHVRWLGRSTGA